MRTTLVLIFFILQSVQLFGQNSRYLGSPFQSVRTNLYYLQPETYNDSLASLPYLKYGGNKEKAQWTAIKLKQILDGEGIYIDVESLPAKPDYFDSLSEKHQYALTKKYPDIYLVLEDSEWIYPKSSIETIHRIHKKVFRFGTDRIISLFPKQGNDLFFGLYIFQYAGILILALLSTVLHKIMTFLFRKAISNALKNSGYGTFAKKLLQSVAQPLSLLFIILLLGVLVPVLLLPPIISKYVILVLKAMIPLFGTITIYRLINVFALYTEQLAKKTDGTLDDQLIPLMRKTLKTFVIAIGTLFVLDNLEINVIPVLTGLSIGGLAFALAAQDTIKNFFGSVMIFVDKPFQIGDWITTGEVDGNVEEVGFRSSRVRTFRNSLTYIPNGKLADAIIDNHGLRKYRRFYTNISVQYDTPPSLLDAFIEGLRKIVDEHPETRKDYYNVYLNEMSASSLDVMFYIFFEVPTWPDELRARHEVLMEVAKLAEHLGVKFAFPTQTLHVETMPDQHNGNYIDQNTARVRLEEYFHKP
ncbi:MAG: mechanosensitive ion channel family protein [Cytophagales bacterium]|nr:mechanosensitive ion channel family protein [Cytophagales bacterium]